MTAWMPTHASNLWVIRPGSSLPYSRAMHADHPWDVTLYGSSLSQWLFSGGAYYRVPTPHARVPCDLGLPLLVAGVWIENHLVYLLLLLRCRGPRTPHPALVPPPPRPPLPMSLKRLLPALLYFPADPIFKVPPCWLWSTPEAGKHPRTGRYMSVWWFGSENDPPSGSLPLKRFFLRFA